MKKNISLILILTFVFCVVFHGAVFSASIGILIDGNMVIFDSNSGEPFIDSSGRTQVPLRAVMEAFGCSVSWDDTSYSAIVSKDDTTVTVPVGQNYIIKNGIIIPNDTSAQIKDSRTYLPIRVVLEAFGAYVTWDGNLNCVNVITSSPLMQVIFLDIGQGDSTLIDFGNYEVLIDAADNAYGIDVTETIRPYVDGSIELVIATHPDADHIGGMDDVFNAYKIDKLIDSGYTSDTHSYLEYINSALNEGCDFEYDTDTKIDIGYDAYINIIETGDNRSNPNDSSIVAELVYGNTNVLFTGDISQSVESSDLYRFADVDVLKVAHHGSATSTSQTFLDVVKPEYAVISAGANNRYGHPTYDTLLRLTDSGTKVLGTFKDGDIILNINSDTYSFNKSGYLSPADAEAKENQTQYSADVYDSNINSANDSISNPYNESADTIVNTDTSYTDISYIGNKSTMKFHKADCSYAQKTAESNKDYIATVEDAVNKGYVGCKVCNP